MPTVLYGAETWGLRESERKKLNVFEMRCLRSMIGVTRRDRVRNTVIRERTGMNVDLSGRADKRCFEMVRAHGENGRCEIDKESDE